MDAFLSKNVLLIGETHKKEQSFVLVKAVLDRALETHRCVAVAVEIPTDQQEVLEAVRAGTAEINQVEIWHALDFPPYHAFLAEMVRQSRNRPCLRIHAVDLPRAVEGDRDAWMAEQIIKIQGKDTLVIALLGTLHVARGIRYASFSDARNVADRLEAAGSSVAILAQDWPSKCTPGLVRPSTEAYAAFINDINRIINGTVSLNERPPVDAVFNWCR
ncbi:hypothetical protein [Nevskia ramosa]|uniref:hypothetical protein n=1 Tax=Nevskia ramosa TaxID=64002 RepID=UPI003D131CC4